MRELIIGYQTALDFWRSARVAEGGVGALESEGKVYGARPLSLREQAKIAEQACASKMPIDVVTSSASKRYAADCVQSHVWGGPLVERWLFAIGNGLLVCRMPVVFSQLATSLDEIELARIAHEMTGTYGEASWEERGIAYNLRALVSVDELCRYAGATRSLGIPGGARALSALRLVTEGSNSPRESDASILLGASRTFGGLGHGGFALNKRIRLPERLAQKIGQRVVIPDFFWPNGTLLEYDSNQEHNSPEAREHDERKRRAYQKEGLDCLTLTNSVLSSNSRLEAFAEDLAKSLGVRQRPPSDRMLERRADLRERLFGPEHVGDALRALNHG